MVARLVKRPVSDSHLKFLTKCFLTRSKLYLSFTWTVKQDGIYVEFDLKGKSPEMEKTTYLKIPDHPHYVRALMSGNAVI